VCDGCRRMLVDGATQLSPHRVVSGTASGCGTPSHYCDWRCMLTYAQTQPRDVMLILAQEAVQLRVIESIAADVSEKVINRLQSVLVSRSAE
jgi:hypothetical protein